MGVSAIGTGLGSLSGLAAGNGSPDNTRQMIQNKLTELKKQKDSCENDLRTVSDASVRASVRRKLNGIGERISNLEKRLENMETDKSKETDEEECQTCKNRKYQDGSDDPGVSFKMPTKIAPAAAEAAVRGHEMEHVYRNRAKAAREDKEVVYQNVTIKHGICPECGKPYVAGGVTKTVTRPKQDDRFNVGLEDPTEKGRNFNSVA